MDTALASTQLVLNVAMLITLVWALVKMFENARDSKVARAAAVAAATRAEEAACLAASHSLEAASKLAVVAQNVEKIELATNSMKDALVASTAKASEMEGAERGRAEEVARRVPP